MAKAITHIEKHRHDASQERAQTLDQLLNVVTEHKEALLAALDILSELHRAGVLDILRGLLENRHEVGAIAINQFNRPDTHRMIKNAIGGVEFLSRLDPEEIQTVLKATGNGIRRANQAVQENERTGFWDLVKTIRDPDVRSSFSMLTGFVQGMGEAVRPKP
ncbi:uncharacterized protein YjgD (DUF1641 family) [Melghirimyces profundicolus]|uniref:Uncharacterized protein YjgD (DUF1641 family) n=1 Tax=Melghirimyces profundicolus TaxID=1242148 RepID=A0A2T6C0L0_9BACL|nr:DUF1641 domain-containing protein [Melghirimyces profundicolus]PTX61841.1 uncharacterized protein YjgD (DUF1641 family) [Melghirimyces profundicolus]